MIGRVIFPLFTAMSAAPRVVPTQSRGPIHSCGRKEWGALWSPFGKEGIQQPLSGPRILYLFACHASAIYDGGRDGVSGRLGGRGGGDY